MLRFDLIGNWSEVKLEVIRKYAAAYSRILGQQERLEYYYIDGFSGAGTHRKREGGEEVEGSPRIALGIRPPFRRYFLIDLDGDRVEFLRRSVGERTDVSVLEGDCNRLLLESVFPQVRYEQYRRALCLLDPYGLQLDWPVLAQAGRMGTIDLFLNFPVMDMNRNALWRRPERLRPEYRERMTRFWGDESWFDSCYEREAQLGLFAGEEAWLKGTNDQVAEAFRQRLRQVAGFRHVAKPLPMRNSQNAVVYYLFFASAKPVASEIVEEIFARYR